MRKHEIIRIVSEESETAQRIVKSVIDSYLSVIKRGLREEGEFRFEDIGVLKIKFRAPRKRRDIRRGTEVDVPGKAALFFKKSSKMDDFLDRYYKQNNLEE